MKVFCRFLILGFTVVFGRLKYYFVQLYGNLFLYKVLWFLRNIFTKMDDISIVI